MTSKTLPVLLLGHYQQDGTTLCNLLKVQARDGTFLGVTSLDVDVTYDDGAGEVVYKAAIGMDSSAMETSADLAVDNAEVNMLLADAGPFTAESISAGVLDYGEYVVYRINYGDATQTASGLTAVPNRHELVDRGTTGIVKQVDGVAGVIELRSLQQQLKQNYGDLYSITCRAIFGSMGGGECLFRGACGFDAESLWQNHSVASIGAEADRIFTADSTPAVNGPNGPLAFAPGLVQWLTGNNAGLTSEIESLNGAEITLRFGTPYAIQVSDTCKIRPDCDKTWETCRDDYDNTLNFRGEPKIPLADESSQTTPSTAPIADSGPVIPDEGDDPPPPPPDPPPDPPPPPPPDTSIIDPGFESGGTAWVAGVGWEINGKSPRSGSRSAEYTKAVLEVALVQVQHVEVTPGTFVSASCYVRSNAGGSMGARAILRWYDASDIEISNSNGNTVTSSSWQQSNVSANAPGGAAFVAVGVQVQSPIWEKSVFADDFTWNL